MRKFQDVVFSKECVKFGKELGFDKVYFKELKTVKGKGHKENQKAVRKNIDILIDPVAENKRNFDTAIARIAKDNNVTIAVSLNEILDKKGIARVIYLRNLKSMIKICRRVGNNMIIISGAVDRYGMRNPEQLASLGILIGLGKPKQMWAVSNAYEAIK